VRGLRGEFNPAYRNRQRNTKARLEGFYFCLGEKGYLVDLSKVVILGGHPEDRNVVDSGNPGGLTGTGDGCSGLEERKQGATEEDDLLPGDDGASSIAETFDVGKGLGAGTEALILAEEFLCKAA
jgi:hypothetical protein